MSLRPKLAALRRFPHPPLREHRVRGALAEMGWEIVEERILAR